jgi:hypothetical protein
MQTQRFRSTRPMSKGARPQVEELDARIVPAVLLTGQGQGTYSADLVQSGAGAQYRLSGNADIQGLGHVSVSGSLHGVGFIQHGHAGGTLTFTNAHGSLTVDLIGPIQDAFSPLPELFNEQIVSGTGAYAHWTGHEGAQLDLWPVAGPADKGPHGTFTLIENTATVQSPLHGTIEGTIKHQMGMPDAGAVFALHGAADLAGLGQVNVTGTIHGVGMLAQGHATGTLTIANAHGTVTLSLVGPVQSGFSALPGQFHFKVVGSTGQYRGLVDEGNLTLELSGLQGPGLFAIVI